MVEYDDISAELAAQAFNELKKTAKFDISECNNVVNIDDNPKFKKLALTGGQKMQMAALAGQLPAVMGTNLAAQAAASSSKLYLVNCPWGIENTLRQMSNGNFANFIHDGLHFRGYAPITPVGAAPVSAAMATQAVVMGTFAAMSVASGQYYLTQINNELSGIKKGMDEILAFLYGDKKAELMSEISFAKYAYENYSSIMMREGQIAATIASLQSAKKIAMKDAEFYISDLGSTLSDNSGIDSVVRKACMISESLDAALQLAVMSSILEVYYSKNFDKEYLGYIEHELSLYIDKCDKFKLGAFSKLHERVESYKALPTKKIDKESLIEEINDVLLPLQNGDESELKHTLRDGLYSSGKRSMYYLSSSGDVYIKES